MTTTTVKPPGVKSLPTPSTNSSDMLNASMMRMFGSYQNDLILNEVFSIIREFSFGGGSGGDGSGGKLSGCYRIIKYSLKGVLRLILIIVIGYYATDKSKLFEHIKKVVWFICSKFYKITYFPRKSTVGTYENNFEKKINTILSGEQAVGGITTTTYKGMPLYISQTDTDIKIQYRKNP